MSIHVMVDLETASTRMDAVILTIGAVRFNPENPEYSETFYIRPSLEEQETAGRHIDDATAEWWAKQSSEAIEEAWSDRDREPYAESIDKLQKFIWGCDFIWSNGANFDIPICQFAFHKLDMIAPYSYWAARDCRTLYDIAGVKLSDGNHVTTHNALEDAQRQAELVIRSYDILKAKGITWLR